MKYLCLTNWNSSSLIFDFLLVVFDKAKQYFCNPKYNFNHAQNAHSSKQTEVSACKVVDLIN